jgi:hypothetical protein
LGGPIAGMRRTEARWKKRSTRGQTEHKQLKRKE